MFPSTGTYYDPQQKLWSGPERKDFYSAKMTLGEAAYLQCTKNPKKIIQINDTTSEKMTAHEFLRYATALSKNLLKFGLKVGDVVGLFAQNCTHTATVMMSSYLCGTPVNALYPGFDRETVKLIYKITTPKIIFCDVENYEIAFQVVEDLNLKCPLVVMNGELEGVSSIRDLVELNENFIYETFAFPCSNLDGDDTAVIICSSGTTGIPKAVQCSHRMLLSRQNLTMKYDAVVCSFSTMYWISGLSMLNCSLLNGCLRVVVNKPFTPDYFLQVVERHKITHTSANTTQAAEIFFCADEKKIKKCLATVNTLIVGGSKVPLIVQENMNRMLKEENENRPGCCVVYGMSEIAGSVSFSSSFQYKAGTEGKLTTNIKARILSKNGEFLGPNEHGEIIVSTPYTWRGYYGNVEATKKAYIDKWLYTGDIGFFDDDGFLHVCGRDNDVFKARNFQIYPPLIEDVVMQLPGVLEACVFGIPDLVASHLIACVVVRKRDDTGSKLTAEHVTSHVASNMSSAYHLTGGVYFVDDIPKNVSGKVQRGKLLDVVQRN